MRGLCPFDLEVLSRFEATASQPEMWECVECGRLFVWDETTQLHVEHAVAPDGPFVEPKVDTYAERLAEIVTGEAVLKETGGVAEQFNVPPMPGQYAISGVVTKTEWREGKWTSGKAAGRELCITVRDASPTTRNKGWRVWGRVPQDFIDGIVRMMPDDLATDMAATEQYVASVINRSRVKFSATFVPQGNNFAFFNDAKQMEVIA